LFCVKARYDQKTDTSTLTDALDLEITTLLKDHAINVSYNAIATIDYYEAENIRERLFKETATMQDKYCLQKYFFTNKFETLDGVPHSKIAELWDNKLVKFVEQVEKVLYNPDHLFNHIAKELAVEPSCLFSGLKDKHTILSAEIINRIFNEFVFTNMTRDRKNHRLILTYIYNKYFGNTIIKTVPGNDKHLSYELQEVFNDVVKFMREHHVNRNGWKNPEYTIVDIVCKCKKDLCKCEEMSMSFQD
jgi:hypothetical protein